MILLLASIHWTILALLAAVFDSAVHLFSKTSLRELDEFVASSSMCFVGSLVSCLVLTSSGFWTSDAIQNIDAYYWFLVFVVSFVAAVGTILFFKALKCSEVSISVPLLCFSPLISCFWSALLLDEYPSQVGMIGVLITLFGAYSLELGNIKHGFFGPIKALTQEAGARYTFLAALCWSFTVVLDKKGSLQVSPIFWTFCICTGLGLSIVVLGLLFADLRFSRFKAARRPAVFFMGMSYGLMHMCQMTALTVGVVPYVISIKRLGILFSVIAGALLFKETKLKQRLFAASIMVVGVIVIAFFS